MAEFNISCAEFLDFSVFIVSHLRRVKKVKEHPPYFKQFYNCNVGINQQLIAAF
jgi:hypothetical protein